MLPRARKDRRRESGTVGIGTMIVFIASVLVAAIAAAVLIDTSGKLQERSARTGNEATDQVSSNMQVEKVIGRRDDANEPGLNDLDVYVRLAPASQGVDLTQLTVQLKNGTLLKTFTWADGAAAATTFNVSAQRDADGSLDPDAPVLTSGDYAKITIALDLAGAEFGPRQHLTLVLLPEVGNSVEHGLLTPATFGQDTLVELK